MKNFYFLILFLFCVHFGYAQLGGEDEVYLDGSKIEAKFQGGNLNVFQGFVLKNLDKSKIEKEGQLICSFTINEEGSLKNIRIVKDLGGQSAIEMIRVLQLSPKWQPAIRNGKPFATTYKIPFTFTKKKPDVKEEDTVTIDVIDNEGLNEEDKVYVAVEKQPEFPGGVKKMASYFATNLKSTHLITSELKAMTSFIVNKDGSLTNVEILRLSVENEELKEEIRQILMNSPKWAPGMQNGKIVRVKYMLPINLRIN
ncbi:energy transducer TonB [Flavobacterium enshiense]|uniref:energy transducer TonB n=1 Tax=Flavobacterium enshiense TaxID=1341165 RepID=UPI00345D4CB2